ncbi:MAG: ribosylnicotinamide kinase [Claussenomyces sp. TS43310]|nr:MAG: ribosylnicotinamide kinase [Claussenomyces sp. TS43310]
MSGVKRKALVVGVSGASSSGKTTLARLIRDIFPNTFVLHEDDFYKEEKDIPTKEDVKDWDCPAALSIPDMVSSLKHIQENGTLPPDFDSKEDRNDIGPCPVPDSTIANLRARVDQWTQPGCPGHGILESSVQQPLRMCIFDGFLLYSPSMNAIQPHMDIKLFLRVSYAKAKERREARSGYATIEGFWQDPPGYVDQIVWPNYVEEHRWMFEDGDVEGKLKDEILKEWNIQCQVDKGPDVDMETTLKWTVSTLMKELEGVATKPQE